MSKVKDKAAAIFARLQAQNPEPKGELHWTNPFTLLVAVVLSAQATDKGVNKATEKLFALADTPEKMRGLGLEGIRDHIKTIGLFNAKANNVYTLCQQLIERHKGAVPQTMPELTALAGVGRKTANVVLNIAFGQPTLAVDTHVFRVAHRLGLSKAGTPDGVEADLLKCIPSPYLRHAHHWLILHGRYTCTARAPKCKTCVLCDICTAKEKQP